MFFTFLFEHFKATLPLLVTRYLFNFGAAVNFSLEAKDQIMGIPKSEKKIMSKKIKKGSFDKKI